MLDATRRPTGESPTQEISHKEVRLLAAIDILVERGQPRWASSLAHIYRTWRPHWQDGYASRITNHALMGWLKLSKEKLPLSQVLPWIRRVRTPTLARSLQGQAAYFWLVHWIRSGRATRKQIVQVLRDRSPNVRLAMFYATTGYRLGTAVYDARVVAMVDPDPRVNAAARSYYTHTPAPLPAWFKPKPGSCLRPALSTMKPFVRLLDRRDISAGARAAAEQAVKARGYRLAGRPGALSLEPISGWRRGGKACQPPVKKPGPGSAPRPDPPSETQGKTPTVPVSPTAVAP